VPLYCCGDCGVPLYCCGCCGHPLSCQEIFPQGLRT
jgi:hypothetical protein